MIYAIGIALLIVSNITFKKSGNFFKALFSSVFGGVGALCAVYAISYFLPLTIGLNWYTILFASCYSVPGVIFMLIGKTFLF
ncbi:MAG: pro-sigmaK processing inhibitor BofA family protein [Acutalibacteraceae bacterium]